jgi:hypothetical protein
MDPKRQPPPEAPFDDGNRLGNYIDHGSYMTPVQATRLQAAGLHAAERAAQVPARNGDLAPHTRGAGVVRPLWLLRAATLFIAVTTFFFRRQRSDRGRAVHG